LKKQYNGSILEKDTGLSTMKKKDIFVHHTAVPIGVFLTEGDQVEFEQEESERGRWAVDVQKV